MGFVRQTWLQAAFATVAVGAVTGVAHAETATPEPQTSAVQEVIVTAEKRSESLQKVPVAITAVSSARIEQSHITGAQDLQFLTPSLTFSQNSNYTYVTIRGIGTDLVFLSGEAAVATYVDGVYNGSILTGQVPNFDLQRIEILRGPQGTLYGRNATGGVINYITRDPEFEPGATISTSYGNYDSIVVDADATGALVPDVLAGRLSLHFNEHDGYRFNLTHNDHEDGDLDRSAQGTLLFKPNEALKVILRGDFTNETTSNPHESISQASTDGVTTQETPLGIFSLPAAALAAIPNILSPQDLARLNGGSIAQFLGLIQPGPPFPDPTKTTDFTAALPNIYRTEVDGGSATVDWSPGSVDVKSITAFRHSDVNIVSDNGGLSFPIVALWPLIQKEDQFTQEIDVSGKAFGDRLDWLAGGFYFHDVGDLNTTVVLPATQEDVIAAVSLQNRTPGSPYTFNLSQPLLTNFFQVPGQSATLLNSTTDPLTGARLAKGTVPSAAFIGFLTDQTSQSAAGFAQATYHVTDRLRLTGGIRYTSDTKDVTRTVHSNLLTALGATGSLCEAQKNSKSWSAVTGTFGGDFDVAPNTLAYAKVSSGYKAGGFNSSDCGAPFNPEKLMAYEAGVKTTLFDGQLRLDVAAYDYQYDNIQFTYYANASTVVKNAASATAYGAEAEYDLHPHAAPGLTFDGSFSLEHSEYGHALFQDPAFLIPAPGVDIKGNELIGAPDFRANFGAQYTADAGDKGSFTIRGDAAYTDTIFMDVFNGKAPFAADTTQPPYWVVNAYLAWRSVGNRYEAQVFADNLTNAYYASIRTESNNPAGLVNVTGQFAAPRTFGVRLIVKLGSEAR